MRLWYVSVGYVWCVSTVSSFSSTPVQLGLGVTSPPFE